MPKAEVGTTKYLNNKLKSKGLQRLRWYCQVCERQMRDENGFKCHVASESHVRQMLVVGENSSKFINDYSSQFKRDFLQLLRTSHGEKKVNLNHFYQEYIRDKEHVHMNATRFQSLTEFGKQLGREGICRVEESDKGGLEIGWIDNSPESLRRQDAIRKKERQDKGDEEREQRLIAEQVERAKRDADAKADQEDDDDSKLLQREEGGKIKLNFGSKPTTTSDAQMPSPPTSGTEDDSHQLSANPEQATSSSSDQTTTNTTKAPEKVSLKMGFGAAKSKNVFGSASKKNALGGSKPAIKMGSQKPMSEAERIMKEEIERKRAREGGSAAPMAKRMRV